jgi:hypothetical protein
MPDVSWEEYDRLNSKPTPSSSKSGSSPYTPTTDEVCLGYVGPHSAHAEQSRLNREAEFDRWLASEKAKAWDEGFNKAGRWLLHGEPSPDVAPANPYREGA